MQGYASERETVRILAQPSDRGFLGLRPIREVCIAARLAAHVDGYERIFQCVAARIGEAVPRPLSLGHQRYERRVFGLERLQTGDIDRERDIAVADHDRRRWIDRREARVVPRDQRAAIDAALVRLDAREAAAGG